MTDREMSGQSGVSFDPWYADAPVIRYEDLDGDRGSSGAPVIMYRDLEGLDPEPGPVVHMQVVHEAMHDIKAEDMSVASGAAGTGAVRVTWWKVLKYAFGILMAVIEVVALFK